MSETGQDHEGDASTEKPGRRRFLSTLSTTVMAGGLIGGYGTFIAFAGRFLFPAKPLPTAWLFVGRLEEIRPGDTINYEAPAGQDIIITRIGEKGTAEDFLALSTTCPHMGCRVHWQAQNDRFFCPCHNGAFSPTGEPTAGPPKDANQPLPRYPLKVEDGMVFVEVRTTVLTEQTQTA